MINIGDLVECRVDRRVGVVIKRRPGVEGLSASTHVNHIIGQYQYVYYVLFSDDQKCEGPFYADDLYVKQMRQESQTSSMS